MDKAEKTALYDRVCAELSNYENSENSEEVNIGFLHEFYCLLVEIQNSWDELTTESE